MLPTRNIDNYPDIVYTTHFHNQKKYPAPDHVNQQMSIQKITPYPAHFASPTLPLPEYSHRQPVHNPLLPHTEKLDLSILPHGSPFLYLSHLLCNMCHSLPFTHAIDNLCICTPLYKPKFYEHSIYYLSEYHEHHPAPKTI